VRAERDDEPRLEKPDLAIQVRAARPCGGRVESILRGMALHEVDNSERFRGQPQPRDGGVEATTGAAHEGKAGAIFGDPRGFSHEEHSGREAPPVDDRVGPREGKGALRARTDLRGEAVPRVGSGREVSRVAVSAHCFASRPGRFWARRRHTLVTKVK
jgi:hypothetical protein